MELILAGEVNKTVAKRLEIGMVHVKHLRQIAVYLGLLPSKRHR